MRRGWLLSILVLSACQGVTPGASFVKAPTEALAGSLSKSAAPVVSNVAPEVSSLPPSGFLPEPVLAGLRALEPFGADLSAPAIIVDPSTQIMYVASSSKLYLVAPVSTGRGGLSSRYGSGGTPTGALRIVSVRSGRWGESFSHGRPTGKIVKIGNGVNGYAYMTTRLFVLEGLEAANASTKGRGIYIHGTNLEGSLGTPRSHGCVRISNKFALELDALIDAGTFVYVLNRR